jgi:hypothetical protein
MEDRKMNKRKINTIFLGIFLVILIALPSPATAADSYRAVSDEIKIGDNFILFEDQTYEGNLFILGGTVTLERNSTLNGDIVMLGANLVVNGTINGDVVTLGGVAEVNEEGRVIGDINSAGAYLDIDPEAHIEGDINTETSGSFWRQLPAGVRVPRMDITFDPFLNMLWFAFRTLLWALLAILTVMFLPKPADRVAHAVVSEPWLSGGLGLLTVIIAPVVLVILSLTIILIPLTFTAFIALVIAWAFGLISLGLELGRRFEKVANRSWHPALSAGIGTLVLILVINGLDALIPCLGWIPKLIFGVLGLGSVLITFFGTRNYPITPEGSSTAHPSLTEAQIPQVEDSSLSNQE